MIGDSNANSWQEINLSSLAIQTVSSEKANLSAEVVEQPGTRSMAVIAPLSAIENDSTMHGLMVCSETIET